MVMVNLDKQERGFIMSFITAVVGSHFVSVTADGRGRTQEGVIVGENIVKMVRPKENLVIAYTGIKEACEEILSTCNADIENDGFNTIVSEINERLNSNEYEGTKLSFIIAGKNEQGVNQLSTISNYIRNTNEIVIGDEMKIAHSGSQKINDNNPDFVKIYNEYMDSLRNIRNLKDIVQAQHDFSYAVADIDESVNKNIKHIVF